MHRLFARGGDRAAERWREDYLIPGAVGLDLYHLHSGDQAMAFLGDSPSKLTSLRVRFAAAKTSSKNRYSLFERRRDLFTEVELAFFDTTSL